jgi:hypothetical protein
MSFQIFETRVEQKHRFLEAGPNNLDFLNLGVFAKSFRDWDSGCRVVQGFGFQISGFGFWVLGFGFRVSGFRISVLGYRVEG